jgi:hypothetical protein
MTSPISSLVLEWEHHERRFRESPIAKLAHHAKIPG